MMKIYLIDDDASVCNILKIIIQQKKLGEVCGTASNGMDALEDLAYVSPDIVVVDLLMPIMDGINFVRKAKEQYPDISYVMLSQVSSKEMISQAYECGVTFFIQKPVNADLLRLKIKRQLFVRDLKIQNHLLQEKLQQVKTRIDSIFDEIM